MLRGAIVKRAAANAASNYHRGACDLTQAVCINGARRLQLLLRSLSFGEILWKQLVGFVLEREVRQNPAAAGHLEVKPKVNKSNVFDI